MIRVAVALLLAAAAPAQACGLALVLALDVSLSVDAEEFSVQTRGTAAALSDDRVQAALLAEPGGISLAVMQWSGRHDQAVTLPWSHIRTAADLAAAADRIGRASRAFSADTAPGSAIAFAEALVAANPVRCARRVIDISGDGIENSGLRTRTASAAAVGGGITINGLVILGDDPRVEDFYRHNVIGGAGAFLEIAHGYSDYPRAIRDKLLKEVPPMLAMRMIP